MGNTWSGSKSHYDEKGSVCASLFLHALLFLALGSTSNFDPAIGKETRIDLVWLTPSPAVSPAPQAAGTDTDTGAGEASHAAASKEAPVPTKGAVAGRIEPEKIATSKAPTTQPTEREYHRVQTQEPEAPARQLPELHKELKAEAKLPDVPLARSAVQKAPEARGLVIASLQGDLKMLIAGDGVKLSVSFREYPRSRSSKMPTRSEARRLRSITPVCAKRADQTREAVIEKAGEGVYVFSAEPEHGKTAQASFTLRIYEAGSGEKVATIGSRTISRKSVVAKILMPEAILWDDDDAFTGSLEDSDSTTKFNSQSGLYWKEYAD